MAQAQAQAQAEPCADWVALGYAEDGLRWRLCVVVSTCTTVDGEHVAVIVKFRDGSTRRVLNSRLFEADATARSVLVGKRGHMTLIETEEDEEEEEEDEDEDEEDEEDEEDKKTRKRKQTDADDEEEEIDKLKQEMKKKKAKIDADYAAKVKVIKVEAQARRAKEAKEARADQEKARQLMINIKQQSQRLMALFDEAKKKKRTWEQLDEASKRLAANKDFIALQEKDVN